jgi:hypothetical protein
VGTAGVILQRAADRIPIVEIANRGRVQRTAFRSEAVPFLRALPNAPPARKHTSNVDSLAAHRRLSHCRAFNFNVILIRTAVGRGMRFAIDIDPMV